ncbi:MAG: FKBP-type peptidyl-prolyl cis-trans isomerase [Opitutaceae bacterium]|nr:FKBP-type peptidyl-prolyl cis-trans isomerase [Opitutaceae bacterium]
MRNFIVLGGLGLILATIAIVVRQGWLARKDPGTPINSAMRETLAARTPQWSRAEADVLARDFASAHETKSGMRYVIRDPGTGDATPKKGQWVTAHYEGRLFDGTKFDSSYDRGQGPLRFQVGIGRVIAGWDEALLTMHRGEKRTLVIPYWLAYGERGQGKLIPPKAGLIFHVELIDFQ